MFDALGADRLTPRLDGYTGDTHWFFTPAAIDEQHLAVFFRMSNGVVEEISGGLARGVYRGEGCA